MLTIPSGRTLMMETMLVSMAPYELYRWAEDLFAHRDYYAAAEVLEHLVERHPDERDLAQARELLVRSFYHSARLGRAVEAARAALEREPTNAYLALLLARALERSADPAAEGAHRLAQALAA